MRSKPKRSPASHFENHRSQSVPDVDDPENSAIDAAILAASLACPPPGIGAGSYHLSLRRGTTGFRYVILPEGKSLDGLLIMP